MSNQAPASDQRTDEAPSPTPKQRPLSWMLQAMADAKRAEGLCLLETADKLYEAARMCQQGETEKMEAKNGLPR